MSEPKKLYRDTNNKMISGVCSGVANYLEQDPTVIRLLTVLISLFLGVIGGIILYIIAAIIIPVKPTDDKIIDIDSQEEKS